MTTDHRPTHKLYPHITGLRGDEGENAATLAVVAVLDPSPHYPDGGRIIVGSPETSEAMIGGFSGGPDAIRQLARTLDQAAADVEAATGAAPRHDPFTFGSAATQDAAAAELTRPLEPIIATWTDEDGTGPDGVNLTLEDFPPPEIAGAFVVPEAHRALHIAVSAEPGEQYCSGAMAMIGGALALDRAAAAELHRQLGAWLEVPRG